MQWRDLLQATGTWIHAHPDIQRERKKKERENVRERSYIPWENGNAQRNRRQDRFCIMQSEKRGESAIARRYKLITGWISEDEHLQG